MQQYAQQFVNSIGIITAAILAVFGALAPLVGLVTSALVTSGIVAADSKWAVFVAKVFAFSLHASSVKPSASARETLKVGLVVTVLLALNGCALFRAPVLWDVIETVCESDLAKTSEAQAKAKALGIPVEQVVEVACKFADVIEPYVRQQTAVRQGLAAPNVTAEAVAAAKARGVL
jgi:hypothetical protein